MHYSDPLGGITAERLAEYLQSRGWRRDDRSGKGDFFVFLGPSADDGEPIACVFPAETQSRWFREAAERTIRTVAALDGRTEVAVAHEVRRDASDGLSIRIISPATNGGMLPLRTATLMLEGVRELMVATVRMIYEPAPVHRHMKKEEVEFGDACQLGQTAFGSYVLNVQLPAGGLSREVSTRVMTGLAIATTAKQPDELVDGFSIGMNANMLEAAGALRLDYGPNAVDVQSWSDTRSKFRAADTGAVRLIPETFEIMEEGARRLRLLAEQPVKDHRGSVRTLFEATGHVKIEVVEEGGRSYQIHAYLSDADYRLAVRAHDQKRDVVVTGKISFHGPQRWIDEVIAFRDAIQKGGAPQPQ